MASVGQILQQRRKELKLSIEDCESKTRVSGKFLMALEHDDYGKIPGIAYAKGFLRLYADTLGIDSKALLSQYKRESEGVLEEEDLAEKTEPLDRDLVKRPRSKWWAMAVVAGAVLILLGYLGWLGRGTPQSTSPKPKPIVAPEKESNNTKEKKKAPTQPAPPPQAGVNLTLSVVDTDCWLEIRTDGNLVYSDTMKVDSTKSWHGEKTIYLSAASGRRLKAVFNNQDLGLLNQTGEAVQKTFTPQGVQEGQVQQ